VSIGDIATEGDRLKTLEALRDFYARTLDGLSGLTIRDAAAIGGRLEKVLAEIEGLADPEDHDVVDELRRKRAERLAGTGTSGS